VIKPGSTLAERDDVVDLCRYTLALRATYLALVVVPLQDLRSDSLPGVIVGCARLWRGTNRLAFSPTHTTIYPTNRSWTSPRAPRLRLQERCAKATLSHACFPPSAMGTRWSTVAPSIRAASPPTRGTFLAQI
jgi:hypothetical protein